MSARTDRTREIVRRAAPFLLVALALAASLTGNPEIPQAGPVGTRAPNAALAFVANESVARMADPLTYTAWVNLTGGGTLASLWLNLTFPAGLEPDGANAIAPPACAVIGNLSWRCADLRAGVHTWDVPARVSGDVPVGDWYNATAAGVTYDAGTYASLGPANASLIVVGAHFLVISAANPGWTVDSGAVIQITIVARNVNRGCRVELYCTARDVTLEAAVDPSLAVRTGDPLSLNASTVSNGSELSLNFVVIVPSNASIGMAFWVEATVEYRDFDGRSLPVERDFRLLQVSPVGFAVLLGIGVLVALVAVLATLAVFLVRGQRVLRIEEVFLMHRSGILIRHVSRNGGTAKDDEIVASMLVAVQEFVRDSFRSEATLDEFRFTGRRAAIVRGKHTILAAIVSRGDVRYLIPQIRAALEDLERVHGGILANWDGRMSRLDRAGPIFDRLLKGGYRGVGAWGPPARGFVNRFRRIR